jgi:hypothetical protein
VGCSRFHFNEAEHRPLPCDQINIARHIS